MEKEQNSKTEEKINNKTEVSESSKNDPKEKEIETIVIICPELELTLNLSVEHNFQPVLIHKINGNSEFKLLLKKFKTPT